MIHCPTLEINPASAATYRRNRIACTICFVFVVTSLLAVYCAKDARAEVRPAPDYSELKISDGVNSRPGSFAWSPDGKMIAYITDRVNLYDVGKGTTQVSGIKDPVFLSWAEDDRVLVIFKDRGKNRLCSLDPESLAIIKIEIEPDADAVFPSAEKSKLFLLSHKTSLLKIGLNLDSALFIYEAKAGSTKEIYSFSKIYPRRSFEPGTIDAWIHAGVSPLDGSFLIIEHVKPPVVPPYSKVLALDPVTGEMRDVSEAIVRKRYISACWSPDGRRAAISNEVGRLEIAGIDGTLRNGDTSVKGIYPSWNPRGSLIYFGGSVFSSQGDKKNDLISGGADSIAQWSPEGTALAVAANGTLRLFQGFRPVFMEPDKPADKTLPGKINLLRELLRDRLITREEYLERAAKLLKERSDQQ